MKFSTQDEINYQKWKAYKRLELIPEIVPSLNSNQIAIRLGFDRAWRLLITLLLDELVIEQQVEYLDRCWALNNLEESQRSPSKTLQRLLTLMR